MSSPNKFNYLIFLGLFTLIFTLIVTPIKAQSSIEEPDLIPILPTEDTTTPEIAENLTANEIGDLSKCEFINDEENSKYIICKRQITEEKSDIWLKDSTEKNADQWTPIVNSENVSTTSQVKIYKNILFYLSPDNQAINAYNLENGSTFSQTLEPGSWVEFSVEDQDYMAEYKNDGFSFSTK